MILNRSREVPVIIHFPGMSEEEIKSLLEYVPDPDPSKYKGKYIITTCYTPDIDETTLPIVQQLRRLGVPFYNVWNWMDEYDGNWKWSYKLVAMKKFLDNTEIETKYILFLDARDTIIQRFDVDLVAYIKSITSARLLFNGGKNDHPNEFGKTAINSNYPVYLNSGVYIGRIDYLKEIIEKTLELGKSGQYNEKLSTDDQFLLKKIQQQEGNRIKVDDYCKVFQAVGHRSTLYYGKDDVLVD